ncbi:MAG: hypothetical protein AAGA64_11140 [Bacteroidota bacterium]
MTVIEFDARSEHPLKIGVSFTDEISASYIIDVYEASSNDVVMTKRGNNLNPDDDIFKLPMPLIHNHNRIIEANISFRSKDGSSSGTYKIDTTIYQGEQALGAASVSGSISDHVQRELLFLKLKSNTL